MKRTILIAFLLFLLCYTNVQAQEKVKFGTVPQEDLEMTVYNADTSAVAVVLYEVCDVRYDAIGDRIQVVTDYMVRIKILKAAGQEWGDFEIPFVYNMNSNDREVVSGISGYTYNQTQGKLDKIKLAKEYINEEKTTETRRRMKIAFPNVQVGSVVELKYQLTSPYYTYIDDFFFQRSIPVRYSVYVVSVPEYFDFSKNTMGYERIAVKEERKNGVFLAAGTRIDHGVREMTFEATNLPAIKDDGYVWDVDDFRSKVTFQFTGVQFPHSRYMSFANTWNDIDKRLMEDESFGRSMKTSNLLKNELQSAISADMTDEQKMTAILNLVKGKVKWNEEDRLFVKSVRSALKDGVGSSADMNALLICVLQDAGFNAYPIVMSTRNHGRVFPTYPNSDKLNYFIAGVDIGDKSYYMDASSKYGSVNIIPIACMVDNARAVYRDKPGKWVKLYDIGKGIEVHMVTAKFDEDGVLSGSAVTNSRGILSMSICSNYSKKKNQDEYVDELKTKYKVEINDFEMNGCDDRIVVNQTFSFKDETVILGDEYLYIKPMLFYGMDENPFKAETRKLPIEFSIPQDDMITATFEIPEGYQVEELPKSERITIEDGGITYMFLAKQEGNKLTFNQRLTVTQTIYPHTSYDQIRNIWTHIIAKNNEQIVLKRVSGNN